MKLVHLIQLLFFGVVVFGRAIEEQIVDTSIVTGDAEQLPYRFRYNVANPTSGDYKSQTESRDGAGVVTGMYKVLQPDGCVRVVHYTADAMGFHPTVTYEGDCKRGGSINTAGQSSHSTIPSTKEISTSIYPSSAGLSRPVIAAVPALIRPVDTGVRDPAQESFTAARPAGQQLALQIVEKSVIAPIATTTLSPKISSEIDKLGQSLGAEPLRPETSASGSVPTATANENAVKTAVESEEINVVTLPETLPAAKLPVTVNNTPSSDVQSLAQQSAPVALPSVLTSEVESSNAVPDSILSLLQSFNPIKTVVQDGELDSLVAQPSQFSERTLETEPDSSLVSSAFQDSAVEDAKDNIQSKASDQVEAELRESTPEASAIDSAVAETVATEITEPVVELRSIPQTEEAKSDIDDASVDDEFSFQTKADESIEPKTLDDVNSQVIAQSDEKQTEKERSLGSLAHSALSNIQNFTAPLTQLISSSVPNLTNPVTALLNTFNKNKLTSTVAPSSISPATAVKSIAPGGKILIDGQTEEVPAAERTIVTDHHNNPGAFTGTEGVVSDLPAISEESQQIILISDDTPAEAEQFIPKEESLELKQTGDQNLESISLEVNDPAAVVTVANTQDCAESTVVSDVPIVSGTIASDSESIPAVAEGTSFESLKLAGLESQPTEQVQADIHDTSSLTAPIQSESEFAEADPANQNAESYLLEAEPAVHEILPQSYASISDPVPIIYSQLQTAPYFVHQPAADLPPHVYPPAPVRQSTARAIESVAAMPYGLRVHSFVPNYGTVGNAPANSYVYNQHRRQGQFYRQQHYLPYRRFAPAVPIRSRKKGEAYGMRYAAVQTSPTKSRYAVRLQAVQQPTPLYSSYVY